MKQQDVILTQIVSAFQPHLLTIDYQYANRGVIRRIDPVTLFATRSVEFDFQNDHCTFNVAGRSGRDGILATVYYGKPRRESHIAAVKSTPREVVDTVIAYLTEREEVTHG